MDMIRRGTDRRNVPFSTVLVSRKQNHPFKWVVYKGEGLLYIVDLLRSTFQK